MIWILVDNIPLAEFSSTQSALLGGTALLALVVAAAIALKMVRRRCLRGPAGENDRGFGVQSLEQLRESGLLTDEEFSRIRRKAMAAKLGLSPEAAGPGAAGPGSAHGAKEKLDSLLSDPSKDVDLKDNREASLPPRQDEEQ